MELPHARACNAEITMAAVRQRPAFSCRTKRQHKFLTMLAKVERK